MIIILLYEFETVTTSVHNCLNPDLFIIVLILSCSYPNTDQYGTTLLCFSSLVSNYVLELTAVKNYKS
jgi:hypothetical protein